MAPGWHWGGTGDAGWVPAALVAFLVTGLGARRGDPRHGSPADLGKLGHSGVPKVATPPLQGPAGCSHPSPLPAFLSPSLLPPPASPSGCSRSRARSCPRFQPCFSCLAGESGTGEGGACAEWLLWGWRGEQGEAAAAAAAPQHPSLAGSELPWHFLAPLGLLWHHWAPSPAQLLVLPAVVGHFGTPLLIPVCPPCVQSRCWAPRRALLRSLPSLREGFL